MEAKELRIGNLITMNGKVCRIAKITDKKVHKDISPIPLTGEWLIKFCFHEIGNIYHLQGNTNSATILNNIYLDYVKDILIINNSIHVKVNYVHQLQNLFFTLTGVELQLSST